ncbi:MAG: helix-turn-helix domain-containing protein [Xenococcaceae cyanobacterium MO_188.B19]|nr:helix-turn-helix domain-containing protein [Xenococcaceae cyanobacterium MO_188.B19]
MAKPISDTVNLLIIEEYAKGQISQRKLARKLGVSTTFLYQID